MFTNNYGDAIYYCPYNLRIYIVYYVCSNYSDPYLIHYCYFFISLILITIFKIFMVMHLYYIILMSYLHKTLSK